MKLWAEAMAQAAKLLAAEGRGNNRDEVRKLAKRIYGKSRRKASTQMKANKVIKAQKAIKKTKATKGRMKCCHFQLCRKWYDAIATGAKCHELRSATKHWRSRLDGATHAVFSYGYDPQTRLAPRRILHVGIEGREAALNYGVGREDIPKLFKANVTEIFVIKFEPAKEIGGKTNEDEKNHETPKKDQFRKPRKLRNRRGYDEEEKDAEPEDWIRELMVLADVNSRKKGGGGVADFQQQKKKVVDMAPERWKKEIDGVAFQANTKGIHGAAIDKIIEEVKKSEAKEASSVPSAALALQASQSDTSNLDKTAKKRQKRKMSMMSGQRDIRDYVLPEKKEDVMAHGRRLYYRTRSGTASNILFDDVHASWTVEDLLRKIQDEQKMQESLSDLNLYKAHGGPCLDRELEVNSFEEDIGTMENPIYISVAADVDQARLP